MYKTMYLLILASSFAVVSPARAEDTKAAYLEHGSDRAIPVHQNPGCRDRQSPCAAQLLLLISDNAEVMVLGAHGYETMVKGSNGFVCIVIRSWDQDFDDPEFWNPKIRAPMCLNPAAVRSVLPISLKRTEWVLAGVSRAEMLDRTKAAIATKEIMAPETGAMCLMQSKDAYLGDSVGGHWHPHVMFYLPLTDPAVWGANLPGSPRDRRFQRH